MIELPERLLRGAHSRAVLLDAGVQQHELRGPLWRRTLPGRYAWAATDPRHPRQRALAAAANLPRDGAVGGWAAAYLHGARQLDGSTADPEVDAPVLQCLQRGSQRSPDGRVVPFRSPLLAEDIVEVDGVAVTSRLRTAFDLARLAPSALLGIVDLLDPDAAVSGEYDGADHAAPVRRALDHARQESLEEHRLRVVRTAARPHALPHPHGDPAAAGAPDRAATGPVTRRVDVPGTRRERRAPSSVTR